MLPGGAAKENCWVAVLAVAGGKPGGLLVTSGVRGNSGTVIVVVRSTVRRRVGTAVLDHSRAEQGGAREDSRWPRWWCCMVTKILQYFKKVYSIYSTVLQYHCSSSSSSSTSTSTSTLYVLQQYSTSTTVLVLL